MQTPFLLLLGLTACDDTEFARTVDPVEGSGYTAVVEILDSSCTSCHSASSALGDLDLESDPCAALVDVTAANYSGTLVVPGDSANSVLWHKISDSGEFGGVMPQGSAMVQENIDIITDWIDDGADCSDDTGS